MSAVLYARVPDPLKQALAAHAATRGLSQTRAAVELLEQALQAVGSERSLAELEGALERSQSELARTQARLREAELKLEATREREELTARTYTALAAPISSSAAADARLPRNLRGNLVRPCWGLRSSSVVTRRSSADPSARCE